MRDYKANFLLCGQLSSLIERHAFLLIQRCLHGVASRAANTELGLIYHDSASWHVNLRCRHRLGSIGDNHTIKVNDHVYPMICISSMVKLGIGYNYS